MVLAKRKKDNFMKKNIKKVERVGKTLNERRRAIVDVAVRESDAWNPLDWGELGIEEKEKQRYDYD